MLNSTAAFQALCIVLCGVVVALVARLRREQRGRACAEAQADAAQEQARDAERRWRSTAEALPQLIWITAADGTLEYLSRQTRDYTGLSQSEMNERGWIDTIHPDDVEATLEAWRASLASGQPYSVEQRIRRADGEYRWFTAQALPARDQAGRVLRWVGSGTDITALKVLETDLRRAKDLLELGVRGSRGSTFDVEISDGVDLTTARRTIIDVWETLGYESEGPSGAAFAIHPADLKGVERALEQYLSSGSGDFKAEYRIEHHDGRVFWRLARGVSFWNDDGSPKRFLGSFFDITEQKIVEAKLRESEERWRNIAETLPQLVWTADANGITDYFSTQTERFTGVASADLVGAHWVDALHPDDRERVAKIWTTALQTESLYEADFRVRRADGVYRWFTTRAAPLRDASGQIFRWFGTCTDIEDNKHLEAELRASEQRWRILAEAVPQIVYTTRADGTADYFNDRATHYTGRTMQELIGFGWGEVIHPDDVARTFDEWNAALREQRMHEINHRIRGADGTYRWFTTRAEAVLGSDGRAMKWFGTCTDIADLKQLEAELRHAKERLEVAIRSSNLSIWEYDLADGGIETAKQTLTNLWEMLGYGTKEDAPPSMLAVVHPDDAERLNVEIESYLTGDAPRFETEHRLRSSTGAYRWVLGRGVALRDEDGRSVRFVGTSVDITQRKEIERLLRASEERFRATFESAAVGMGITDMQGRIVEYNDCFCQFLGYERGELAGKRLTDFMVLEEATEDSQGALDPGRSSFSRDRKYLRKDGSTVWGSVTASVIQRSPEGTPIQVMDIVQDISARKSLEQDLEKARNRLEFGVRGSNVGIFEFDMPDGSIGTGNQTFINCWETIGYEPATAPSSFSETMPLLIHPDDHERVLSRLESFLASVETHFEIEHRILHRDGSVRWRLFRGTTLRTEEGAKPIYFSGSMVDITRLKQIEGDLKAAREAAETANRAKDEFLANVSHEIRTPMNAILGMTELALEAAHGEPQKQLLSTVRSAAKNLLAIINDLLDFSKVAAGKLGLDEADFALRAEIATTLGSLAPRAHRKNLELVCEVQADVPDNLFGDAGRLRQILMNLVGNALKFTGQGEVVLSVTAAAEDSTAGSVRLVFVVRDTGIGIARDKQAAIFRAFEQEDSSTTRRFGGTGLGLTIAAQLASLMDGTVDVESEPGIGSTFTFTARFVRSSGGAAVGAPVLDAIRGLRVLVADGNETSRRVLAEWLTRWEMRPTTVASADAALATLEHGAQTGDVYSMVLLDARLPAVGGTFVATRIFERWGPSVRIVLLRSDGHSSIAPRASDAGVAASLLKPVQPSDLLRTIQLVVHAHHEPPLETVGARSATTASTLPVLRILVAEDNDLNSTLLITLLRRRGHRTRLVVDGLSAVEMTGRMEFDLVLLDLHMPGMDGFETARVLRERERTTGEHIPIIALTARSSSRDRDRCLAAGMDDFVSKPIDAAALWMAMDRVLATFPPRKPRLSRLLDAGAILRACARERDVFDELCRAFRLSLPQDLARVHDALRDENMAGLAESAHQLASTLGAFSSVAGALAVSLEDRAERGDAARSAELVARLDAISSELLDDVRDLILEDLTP